MVKTETKLVGTELQLLNIIKKWYGWNNEDMVKDAKGLIDDTQLVHPDIPANHPWITLEADAVDIGVVMKY